MLRGRNRSCINQWVRGVDCELKDGIACELNEGITEQADRARRQSLSLQPLPTARGALMKDLPKKRKPANAVAKATAKASTKVSAKASAKPSGKSQKLEEAGEIKKAEQYALKKLRSTAYHSEFRTARLQGCEEPEAKARARQAYHAVSR